jgi:hypothetical protein
MTRHRLPTPCTARLAPALLLAALLLAPLTASAQKVSKVGTTSGQFLAIGVGPRAVALGASGVADAQGAEALYWNPAGLAGLGRTGEAMATHTDHLAGLTHDFVGAAVPALGGHLGLAATIFSVPEDDVRTYDQQDGTGETFDATSIALALSYGRAVTDRFSVGATGKFVQERIWNSTARGVAFDLGVQFRTDFWGGLTLGAALYNFGSDLKLDGRDIAAQIDPDPRIVGNNGQIPAQYRLDSWSLPTDFQIGITTRPISSRLQTLTLSVDALHPASNYESVNVGAEYAVRERVFLRGGYEGLGLGDEFERGFSGGVGVALPMPYRNGLIKVDYAYQGKGRLGGLHVVGAAVTF